jgi:hypothetical protein
LPPKSPQSEEGIRGLDFRLELRYALVLELCSRTLLNYEPLPTIVVGGRGRYAKKRVGMASRATPYDSSRGIE